jgi:DNA-directed RNA polymerase specialized sigma24 family protein
VRGDEDFDAAVDRLLGGVYRHALRMVGGRTLAEDLAAEALARTYAHWRRVSRYDHLDAWVLRVTLAQALRALPARQRDAVVLRYLVDLSEARSAASTTSSSSSRIE